MTIHSIKNRIIHLFSLLKNIQKNPHTADYLRQAHHTEPSMFLFEFYLPIVESHPQ